MKSIGRPFENNVQFAFTAIALGAMTVASFANYLPSPLNFCAEAYEGIYKGDYSVTSLANMAGCFALLAIDALMINNGIAYFSHKK